MITKEEFVERLAEALESNDQWRQEHPSQVSNRMIIRTEDGDFEIIVWEADGVGY